MNSNAKYKSISDIPTLALRGITVFPGALFHFDVGRQKSIDALEQAMNGGQRIFLVTQREMTTDTPEQRDLFGMGTFCRVRQILKIPGDNIRVLVEGKQRARLDSIRRSEPFLTSDITLLPQLTVARITKRDQAMLRQMQELFLEYVALAPQMSSEIVMTVMDGREPDILTDYIAQNIQLRYEQKQELLEELDPRRRMNMMVRTMTEEIEILQIEQDIQEKVKGQIDKNQRDYYLREQVKAISEELGEGEDSLGESAEYLKKIEKKNPPDTVREKMTTEAKRLARMQPSSPESGVIRGWLDVCLEIPWTEMKRENDDIKKASAILEEDHFGLEKVKERILEFFAVKNLTGGVKGQILCLVGPPGVGKTSVARSVARCMGRDYARLSLGGVRDEADIRGHRKTYIGAMPGRIVTALRQAGSRNCLILIDEIDKLGADYKGDPSSALLEVFDTEQNNAFRDHFVELPVDLSDVLFITTANDLELIPRPLLDRMEVIELPGYTDEEKVEIARKHLMPKQLKKNGLRAQNLRLDDDALRAVIDGYTRESGVREMERQIAKLCRKTAKYMTETGKRSLHFTVKNLAEYLGTPKFKPERFGKEAECGVVHGLAWTAVGGELLEVECAAVDGTGKLELTGNLGDVMKESARAALTYLRSRAEQLGLPADFITKKDIHLHFPEGAVPKDGPSAGITVATALYSALSGRPVRRDLAMTGEITLRGRVLPIGGLREKTMAAFRNHLTTVLVPAENEPDLDEIDQTVRGKLTFVFVSHMDEVLRTVFNVEPVAQGRRELPEAEDSQTTLPAAVPPAPVPARIRQ